MALHMPKILKTEQWPQDWKSSVFIPIPKKGNAKICSNYHTIALISHASQSVSSVAQSCPTLCNPMNHSTPGLPIHLLTPGVHPNPCPLSQWCHPTISSSVVPFSSHLHSFPASGSFQMSQFFPSGGQSIGVSASASVLSMNIQDWFPLGWTCLISLLSKKTLKRLVWSPCCPRRLSRVFSNTIVQKHQFFGAQLFYSSTLTSIHDYWENHSFDREITEYKRRLNDKDATTYTAIILRKQRTSDDKKSSILSTNINPC